MTRFILVENAIVQCDEVSNRKSIDTERLFCHKDFFEYEDYSYVFKEIQAFIDSKGDNELIISSQFYLLPCFVQELQTYLGLSTRIIPIYTLIGKDNLIEIYDKHTFEISSKTGELLYRMYDMNILEIIRHKDGMDNLVGNTGFETIENINDYLNNPVAPAESLDDVELFFTDYDKIILKKDGCSIFSPYGSLKFYEEIIPGINHIKTVNGLKLTKNGKPWSFSILFHNNAVSFDNHHQTWMLIEEGREINLNRTSKNGNKLELLTIPTSLIKETELQLKTRKLRFSKVLIDLESDILGNLHARIQSLNNKVIYKLITFQA
jgi:hypothetical protein